MSKITILVPFKSEMRSISADDLGYKLVTDPAFVANIQGEEIQSSMTLWEIDGEEVNHLRQMGEIVVQAGDRFFKGNTLIKRMNKVGRLTGWYDKSNKRNMVQ